MKYGTCELCGAEGIMEEHHAIFRGQSKALQECELNKFLLDYKCHRGENGIHGKNGHEADVELKKKLQERLFNELDRETYELEEVAEILKVKEKDVRAACKILSPVNGQAYETKEVIRKLQGGKLY